MRHNRLGRTGLFVSELCLGTMTFGSAGRFAAIAGLDQSESEALMKTAIDAGINFIDTANVYSEGQSEEITGRALKSLGVAREQLVIATKAMGPMGQGANDRGASRYHLMNQVEASLKRLQIDHIDLYQIHAWDAATPIEETLAALDNLVQRGLVRYIGVSNWAAWTIMKALGVSERLGLERFASLQAYYTIAGRDLEREIVPMLLSENVGLMVWSPLAGGLLSGKYSREGDKRDGRRAVFDFPPVAQDRAYDAIDVMRTIADPKDATVAQIALAWLLHQPVVSTVIVGAKRAEQLTDNIAATKVELSADELARLDQVSKLPTEYPGWMLDMQGTYRAEQLNQPRRGA